MRSDVDTKEHSIYVVIAGLMLAMLLAGLSQTILSTALPTMVGELGGVDQMASVITVYVVTSTIVMPIYGKLGDLLGRKGLLRAAIVIFLIGSLLGGVAPSMSWLIAARAIQGLGGGGLIILAQASVADLTSPRERGKYMGMMTAVFVFTSVAGPVLGGWFTSDLGWRWTFWINLPLGAVALAATVLVPRPRRRVDSRPRLDYLGMVLLSLVTSAVVLIGTWGGTTFSWDSPLILALIGSTTIATAALCLVETRAKQPILSMRLFRHKNFNLTTAAGLFTGLAMFGVLAYLPTYLQMANGASAVMAGILTAPTIVMLLVVATATGWYVSWTGRYKWVPIAGSAVLTVSLLMLSTVTLDTPSWLICSCLGVMGAGLGASLSILTLIAQNTFHVKDVGTVTAANNYFREVGMSLGAAVVGSVFASRLAVRLADQPPPGTEERASSNSLTPELVVHLPDPLRLHVVSSYNDALMPVFLFLAPLAALSTILLLFVDEVPLSASLDDEIDRDHLERGPALTGGST